MRPQLTVERTKTDLLIIGGGLGGCFTAISAADHLPEVAIFEKANISRSGSGGAGLDETQVIHPQFGVTAESFRRSVEEKFGSIGDRRVMRQMVEFLVSDSYERFLDLERKYGLRVHDKEGKFYPGQNMGHWEAHFDGANLKPAIASAVRNKKNIKVFDHTMGLGFTTDANRITGAVGLNIREMKLVVCAAKTVVLATGAANRLYWHLPGGMFLNDYCPACCGDGFAMAYEAGAKLAGMEFVRPSVRIIQDHVLRAGVLHRGKVPTTDYHGNPVKADFFSLIQKQLAGEGPFYFDARGLPEEAYVFMAMGMAHERPISQKFLKDLGLDLRKDRFEARVIFFTLRPGLAGVVADENFRTSLDGLFAIGDVVGGTGIRFGGMMVHVYGHRLGQIVSEYARKVERGQVKDDQVECYRAKLARISVSDGGLHPLEVERKIQSIVMNYVGFRRTETKLLEGLSQLEGCKSALSEAYARNGHELMRALEAETVARVAEMHMRAAITRQETRNPPMHWRADFPQQDDVNWAVNLVITKKDGQMRLEKEKPRT